MEDAGGAASNPDGMSPDERRRRLEQLIPFWTYLVVIFAGLAIAIVIGLTHH